MTEKKDWREFPCLDGESGQVEVESAIVLPMVVFLLLGLLQMGMLGQARMFAKYAAYRAVRTGALRPALNSSDYTGRMEMAALAAALPILGYTSLGSSNWTVGNTDTATRWIQKWLRPGFSGMGAMSNRIIATGGLMKYMNVTVCGPTKQMVSAGVYNDEGGHQVVAFDNPEVAGKGIKTKLRIRLVMNYPLVVPFANWVIFRMWTGQRIPSVLRLDSRALPLPDFGKMNYMMAAQAGAYLIPIQAHYSMKIHADLPVDVLPEDENVCGETNIKI